MKLQPSLFEAERLTLEASIEIALNSLLAYGADYDHWAIAFSGGKDSSAVATMIPYLIATGRLPAPKSLTVLYADTRMELPPLQASAMQIMSVLQERGIRTQVVLPAMDDRFFVYMLGRGIPPPSNTFRWCTSQIKIEPMAAALRALRAEAGEKFLMLTGVRVGESAARDQRIAVSCGKNGSECGQGWFQEDRSINAIADTLAPILHMRECHVFDWLMMTWVHDFPTSRIAEVYAGPDATEESCRTGCVGCNLASRDVALERVIKWPQWEYLSPLRELRPLYAELKRPHNRLRKDGTETRADGSLVSNPQRLGPLTMDARRLGLAKVLEIQAAVNAAAGDRPHISLIDDEELDRIEEMIAANTWPRRWSGEEITGDVPLPVHIGRRGGRQFVLDILGAA